MKFNIPHSICQVDAVVLHFLLMGCYCCRRGIRVRVRRRTYSEPPYWQCDVNWSNSI